MSLIRELRPENIPISKRVNPEGFWTGPTSHPASGCALGARCAKQHKEKGSFRKAPQIAHYKAITAHIHVLLCFRK